MDGRKLGGETGSGTRVIGSKVSQIANIFQNKGNAVGETTELLHVPAHNKVKQRDASISPKHDQKEAYRDTKYSDTMPSSQATVVRTESHVARFNSAKALFEKLGTSEDNRNVGRSGERIKRPSSVSSVPSSHASTESLISPRSPSPRNLSHLNGSVFSKTSVPNGVAVNGSNEPPRYRSASTSESKVNGLVSGKYGSKPEKPERKLNSKELIEKQKNWTSHFSKAKPIPKRESIPNAKNEIKSDSCAASNQEMKIVPPATIVISDTSSSTNFHPPCTDRKEVSLVTNEQNDSKNESTHCTRSVKAQPTDTEIQKQDLSTAEEVGDANHVVCETVVKAEPVSPSLANDVSKEPLDKATDANEVVTNFKRTIEDVDKNSNVPDDKGPVQAANEGSISCEQKECKMAEFDLSNDDNEVDSTRDFIENEISSELKSSCEELDTVGGESFRSSEQEDIIKPVLQFNLGDSANESKLNTSSTTALCNSSISEEDSGFLSSEAIIAMRESDNGLLEHVKFADADDDSETEEKDTPKIEPVSTIELSNDAEAVQSKECFNVSSTFADAMTADEADNLLSVRSHDTLLSDEEAQEVAHLLSPAAESADKPIEERWTQDSPIVVDEDISLQRSTTQTSNMDDSFLSSNAGSISGLEDTYASSHFGSQTGSESGLLSGRMSSVGSVDDLESTLQDRPSSETDDESTYKGYQPEPMKEIFEESGIHYFEDGHFWVEVPGLPPVENIEDLYHIPPKAKQKARVKFSCDPIKVYSTFSMLDYDRRNEDVDPVAASAEYELEKRVEKLEMISVDLDKGPEGLGLSIIGMGVGADAGLEKLGIFVKTITENGAAAKDGKIQVNDQIIEVDGKSLVGVTQAYAASVLRNTRGRVKFLIGREKDTENSEVAQLIRLSLQADKEREDQRRQVEQSFGHIGQPFVRDDSSLTNSYSSSIEDYPAFSRDSSVDSNNTETLRRLLEQNEQKTAKAEEEIAILKARLEELEGSNAAKEEIAEKLVQSGLRLREVERSLQITKRDVSAYQGMLQQSQEQYSNLERKYTKVKKLIKEFQQREVDFLHREEFYQQLLQEKDVEYNALVKVLKDRIIQVEQELLETQRKAGFPTHLPQDNSQLKLVSSSQVLKIPPVPPVRPLLEGLEGDLSDFEDIESEEGKTATVERKIPIKEEFDEAVPQHELLDVSANKSKADLASRGGLANRQLPTTSVKRPGSLSNSSSECTLDDTIDTSDADSLNSKDGVEDKPARVARSGSFDNDKGGSPQKSQNQYQRYVQQKQISQPYQTGHRSIPKHMIPTCTPLTGTLPSQLQQPNPNSRFPANQHATYSRIYQNRNVSGPPPSLAEQLKQVLAERERRSSPESDGISSHPSHGEEGLRGGLNSQFIWQPALQNSSQSSMSSGSLSPGHVGSDVNASGSNFGSTDSSDVWCPSPQPQDLNNSVDKKLLSWQSTTATDWSKEQVCQWLIAVGLEQYISKFLNEQIDGSSLLSMENKDLKTLGIGADDRNKFKRKLKELRLQTEKEKRHSEKERKEKEKLQKKAEKLAEKASRKK